MTDCATEDKVTFASCVCFKARARATVLRLVRIVFAIASLWTSDCGGDALFLRVPH